MKKKQDILPNEWYSLTYLARQKVFPWLGADIRTYRSFVTKESKGKNLLKGVIIGDGRLKRYQFKGENIIKFKSLIEAGKVQL